MFKKEILSNKYLKKFEKLRCKEDYLKIFKNKSNAVIKKEITEAMAIKERLKNIIKNQGEDFILIDVGAGKGYFSILMAFFYKKLEIFMVDKDQNLKLDYMEKFSNIKFKNIDINSKEFENFLLELFKKGKKIVIVAIHLCKDNAKRLIEIYNKYKNNIHTFILVPCCPGNFKKAEKTLSIDPYLEWSLYLFYQIKNSKKVITKDENILSDRNIIIKSTKE